MARNGSRSRPRPRMRRQSSPEPSEAELAAVGDTNPEPAQNVPEHLQSAFVDGDPSLSGGAEVGPTLDDTQFEQPAAEA
jgi:hypothetical protein